MLTLSCSLTFLRLERFFFHGIHKPHGRSLSKLGYRTRKICGGKMYSRTRTFGAKYTNRILESQDMHTKYKILNYIMKHNFFLSNLLTKSNWTILQSYKVKERTFGTPCTAKRAAVRKIQNLVIKELRIFLPERNLQRVRNSYKEE